MTTYTLTLERTMKSKALLKASVISGRPEDNGKRIEIRCYRDRDGRFRWYDSEGGDTEVSGDSLQDAKNIAEQAWAGAAWGLKASWL